MRLTKWIFGIITIFGTFSLTAHAGSLNCKGGFAETGDSKGSVLFKCGEPMLKDSFLKHAQKVISSSNNKSKRIVHPVTQCESIDEWTYNPGSGQFLTTLQFERGVLVSIKYGARIP